MSAFKATPKKLTAAGNILAAPGGLSSLTVNNPTGGVLTLKMNNAISGTTNEILEVTVPANDFRHMNWYPALAFSTGIRAGTVGSGLIVTGGFITD